MTPRERRELGLVLALALVARLVAWPFVDGFVMPDEYFQALEPAHHLVFGHGVLSWEWDAGLRSWAVPYAYAALFRVADVVGLSGPGELGRLAQLANVLLSLLIVSSSWRLGRLAGRRAALVAGLVAATSAPLLFHAPRTLLDCGSAAFFVAALARFGEATRPDDEAPATSRDRNSILAGVLLGLAYTFRYTTPIFFVGPSLFLLRHHPRSLRWLVVGFGAVFAALGLLDWLTWGRPFHSLIAYLSFNVIEGGSARYGVEPPGWYLEVLAAQGGWLWTFGFALAALGLARRGPLGACGLGAVLGLGAISAIAHKEERFLLPLVALSPVAFALGAERMAALTRRLGARASTAIATSVLALVIGSSWLAWGARDWAPHGGWIEAMRWIGLHTDDVHGVLATTGWANLGGDVVHRRNLPLLAGISLADARLETHPPLFDTLVTDLGGLTQAGGVSGARLAGWREVARFRDVVVMQRR